jgi:Fe-S cluster biogenesis protein NfuA
MTDEPKPAENTAPEPAAEGSALFKKVDEVLDRIRPYVQMDGGYVELVNVNEEEGVAFIRFQGACSG